MPATAENTCKVAIVGTPSGVCIVGFEAPHEGKPVLVPLAYCDCVEDAEIVALGLALVYQLKPELEAVHNGQRPEIDPEAIIEALKLSLKTVDDNFEPAPEPAPEPAAVS